MANSQKRGPNMAGTIRASRRCKPMTRPHEPHQAARILHLGPGDHVVDAAQIGVEIVAPGKVGHHRAGAEEIVGLHGGGAGIEQRIGRADLLAEKAFFAPVPLSA